MTDPFTRLGPLRRPALLMKAARHAARAGNGPAAIRRLFGDAPPRGRAQLLNALIEVEGYLEDARRARDAGYNPTRHVDVVAALLREAAREIAPAPQVKASETAPLRLAM